MVKNDDRIIYTDTIRRYLKWQINIPFVTFLNNLWYYDTIYSNKPVSYTYSSLHNNEKGPIRTGILALVKWSESFFPNLKLFFGKWTFINVHFSFFQNRFEKNIDFVTQTIMLTITFLSQFFRDDIFYIFYRKVFRHFIICIYTNDY